MVSLYNRRIMACLTPGSPRRLDDTFLVGTLAVCLHLWGRRMLLDIDPRGNRSDALYIANISGGDSDANGTFSGRLGRLAHIGVRALGLGPSGALISVGY